MSNPLSILDRKNERRIAQYIAKGFIMSSTSIKKEIYRFIIEELIKDISDEVFNCNSFEELGEYYFKKITSSVPNSKPDDIIMVLDSLAEQQGKHLKCDAAYYSFLCEMIRLIRVPKDALFDVNDEYHAVFEDRYNEIKKKYDSAIAGIQQQQSVITSMINGIGNQAYDFMRDITSDIETLRTYYRKQNELRTQESILNDNFNYYKERLFEYCDFDDEDAVIEKNRKIAIECSLSIFQEEHIEDRFLVYKQFASACENILDNYNNFFFDIKVLPFILQTYRIICSFSLSQEEKEEKYKDAIECLHKERDALSKTKSSDLEKYNKELNEYISCHSILELIKDYVKSLVCLDERRNILNQIVKFYDDKNYIQLINTIPIQIEGIFSDLQNDIKSFDRFSHCKITPSADLKEKVNQIQDSIPFEYALYYKHYFNNLIRNIVAHGRIIGKGDTIKDEVLAKELILDFHSLLYMVSRNSEAEKMYRFINGYIKRISILSSSREKCFMALYNDLIGERVFLDYDSVDKYSPVKVVFWIVNPYYEKLYNFKAEEGDTSLYELRKLLLSKEFWEYAKEQTKKYCEWHWHEEALRMLSRIIKGLLSCDESKETKDIMIDILKILKL